MSGLFASSGEALHCKAHELRYVETNLKQKEISKCGCQMSYSYLLFLVLFVNIVCY